MLRNKNLDSAFRKAAGFVNPNSLPNEVKEKVFETALYGIAGSKNSTLTDNEIKNAVDSNLSLLGHADGTEDVAKYCRI